MSNDHKILRISLNYQSTVSCTLHFNEWNWIVPPTIISISISFSLSCSELSQTSTVLIKTCNFTPFQIKVISYYVQVSETFFTIALDT